MWNYGFPQEMEHFVDCVKNGREPLVNGDHGPRVMDTIFAACGSAGTGRPIEWPYEPPRDRTPIELWGR